MKIAIIGSGIAGNAAAWALNKKHDVTLYESQNRAGGHAATVDINYEGSKISVDTGFIVYNEPNYPDLVGLFDHLDIETIETNMSFSVSTNGKVFNRREWNLSNIRAILASGLNFFDPKFIKLIWDVKRFARKSIKDLEAGKLYKLTLDQYCQTYSKNLAKEFLIPMGAAIWSTPGGEFGKFPADNFVRFFANHKILDSDPPIWRSVRGGSRNYVHKILESLVGKIKLSTKVTNIRRENGKIYISAENHDHEEIYDHVIIACHSDQALKILDDATAEETAILQAIPYKSNSVFLHRDTSLMPRNKNLWAAWNYVDLAKDGKQGRDICVSYWMNKLQSLDPSKPIFVTLNPPIAPKTELTFGHYNYSHPVFDADAMQAQKTLKKLQGASNTWFCGAWTGYGFHEDGLKSGLDIAQTLGADIPWRDLDKLASGGMTLDAAE